MQMESNKNIEEWNRRIKPNDNWNLANATIFVPPIYIYMFGIIFYY